MGKRRLLISAETLVIFLMDHDRAERFIIVENPIPDDAVIVGYRVIPRGHSCVIKLTLSSDTWPDGPETLLELPKIQVHFLQPGCHA